MDYGQLTELPDEGEDDTGDTDLPQAEADQAEEEPDTEDDDCFDDDPVNFPGNTETCDGVDNDCDGTTWDGGDEGDSDSDGTALRAQLRGGVASEDEGGEA